MNNEEPRDFETKSIPSFVSLLDFPSNSDQSEDEVQIRKNMVMDPKCDDDEDLYMPKLKKPNYPGTPAVSEADDYEQIFQETPKYAMNAEELHSFTPQLMIVYKEGDLNSAIHFLLNSLNEPFVEHVVTTILVEECVREELLDRIQVQMRPLSTNLAKSPVFCDCLMRLQNLNVTLIRASPLRVPTNSSPVIACNCLQQSLGPPTKGVICLQSFHSTAEAIELGRKQKHKFGTITIWNETLVGLYQLVVGLDCAVFFANCCNVDLTPVAASQSANNSTVCITNRFHYESLMVGDNAKTIVFPVSSHLIQKSESLQLALAPVTFLNE